MLTTQNKHFISTSGIPSVNRIDLKALTLVGPTITRPVLDPLAVLRLDNRLCGLFLTLLMVMLNLKFFKKEN